jgi:polyvinyl alcohol dehydrogenase (cytochrome)
MREEAPSGPASIGARGPRTARASCDAPAVGEPGPEKGEQQKVSIDRLRIAAIAIVGFGLLTSACTQPAAVPLEPAPTTSPAPAPDGDPDLGISAVDLGDLQWPMSGGDERNSRYNDDEEKISTATAGRLRQKWVIDTSDDVTATPTVRAGVAYFTDYGGFLYAVDTRDGRVIWKKDIAEYTGNQLSWSRSSPAIVGELLIIGESRSRVSGQPAPTAPTPTYIMAIDKDDGRLVWRTSVDQHPAAAITSQPVIAGTRIFVGVSGFESEWVQSGGYPCCSFRGSMVSLDVTGRLEWKTYTVPPNTNANGALCTTYDAAAGEFANCPITGAAVWNTPAVDALRGTVYFGTGNNYTVTNPEHQCAREARAANQSDAHCPRADNHVSSVLAVNIATGRIRWSKRLGGFDAWNYHCLINPGVTWCPSPYGPDFDLGNNTNLITTRIAGRVRQLVGIGQKSGIYWALDPDTGEVVWSRLVGPPSALGGIMWGSATDGDRVYVAISNYRRTPHTLQPSGVTHNGGTWSALNAATGEIIWQTPSTGAPPNGAFGAVTLANGVLFGAAMSPTGENMFAFNAATGAKLWGFAAAGSVNAGASVVNGTVFWGAGYSRMATGGATGAKKMYAFSIDGVEPTRW